ncbi:MAG: magnesium transporter [Lachnospiraceae bacterium]|nr:magnesium transporter [Lachnospiraceae bacterium]
MELQYDFETLEAMVKNRQYRELKEALMEMNEVDIAQFILDITPTEYAILAFRTLPKELAAEVFSNLESDVQEAIINAITDRELAAIMEELYVDDAVDMLEELPANVVKRVLKNTQPDDRQLINQFLKYPENTAGSIMTAEFVDLKENMTVEDAIKRIRRTGEDKETIYTCYVLDSRRHLIGVVTVKGLLLAQDDDLVVDIMDDDVMKVMTTDDQEEVAYLFSKYDLLSIPVVDRENRLVGIITVDDAVDVMEEEVTEDFEKMAALIPSEKPYLRTGIFSLAKNRIPWLMILMLSSTVTGAILGEFEGAFASWPILVTCIPMLTGTGGNAGGQTSTTIVRGMTIKEIELGDVLQVIWKEFRVALICGVALAAVNYVRVLLMYPGEPGIALQSLVISLALLFTVVLANTIAGILPLLAKRLNLDPALVAGPALSTIVDIIALLVYFMIVQMLLV